MLNCALENDKFKIEEYTRRYPELSAAHHFVFNEVRPPGQDPKFVIMGVNPGESDRPETSWTNRITEYLGGRPYVMAELFF
jgi:hypothetical protein